MSFSNRTYDNTVSAFVAWSTPEPDPAGAEYPGPGIFGVDTTGYTVGFVPEPSGTGGNVFVYDVGATPAGNVYNSWAALYADASALQSTVIIELASDLTIPAGMHTLLRVKLRGVTTFTMNIPVVTFDVGAQLFALQFEAENVQITTLDPTEPPCAAAYINVDALTLKSSMTVPLFGLKNDSFTLRSRDLTVEPGGQLMYLESSTVLMICEGATQFDNASVTGGGPSTLNVWLASAATTPSTDIPSTMPGLSGTYQVYALSRADNVLYDDAVVAPQLGVTSPQGALDVIKPLLGTAFVFAPGFSPGGNIYNTWADLHAAVNAAPIGLRKVIVVDEFGSAQVPSGAWRMRGWDIEGRRTHETSISPTLRFMSGATLDTTPDAQVDNSWYDLKFSQLRVRFSGSAWWTPLGTSRERIQFTGCRVLVDAALAPIDAQDGLNAVLVLLRETSVDGPLVNTNTSGSVVYRMLDGSLLGKSTTGSGIVEFRYDDTCSFEDPSPDYSGTVFTKIPLARRKFWVPAGHNAAIAADPGANEVVVGGFTYRAFDDWPSFEALITTAAASVVLKLYDIGEAGTPAAPVLRSTLTVAGTSGYGSKTLDLSTAPGVDADEIYENDQRMYEVRVVADTTQPIYLYSTGLVVDQHVFASGVV